MHVAGVFCDLKKTFDCVNHALLLQKLELCGVRGLVLDWFKSYLFSKEQRVCLKLANACSYSSSWRTAKCGVPNGSVSGPALSKLCIKD